MGFYYVVSKYLTTTILIKLVRQSSGNGPHEKKIFFQYKGIFSETDFDVELLISLKTFQIGIASCDGQCNISSIIRNVLNHLVQCCHIYWFPILQIIIRNLAKYNWTSHDIS